MWGGIFEKNKIKEKIQAFNKKIVQENFWKEKLSAQKILKEKKFLENIIDEFNFTVNELDDLEQLLELATKENNIEVAYTIKPLWSGNDVFEKGRNNEMSIMYPEYKLFLDNVNERIFDLSTIFQKHYLHPDFQGKYSLKKVLPIFYEKLKYSDLPISGGQTANFKWIEMIFGNLDKKEILEIERDLKEYSKLDTEGMVHIYKSLHNLVMWIYFCEILHYQY